MKKYIFSNIKFKIDWRLVFIILGIVICFLTYNACKTRTEYCNIFYKEGKELVEYKILTKKKDDRYDSTGNMVVQNIKTGEIKTKSLTGHDDYFMFESLKEGQTIQLKETLENTLSSKEKEKLWKGREPLEYTWIFILLYGAAMTLFGIFLDDNDEDDLWLRVFGGVFIIVGIIFAVFI